MNRQKNSDGSDCNFSWNCGAEGPTADANIEQVRLRQIKNHLTVLLMSQGTPMLLMGDEVRRTQAGNNNAYCQNNETSWFDWSGLRTHAGIYFGSSRQLIGFVRSFSVFKRDHYLDTSGHYRRARHRLARRRLAKPDLGHLSHTLAFTIRDPEAGEYLHAMFNAYWEKLRFELPPPPNGRPWRRIVDTSLPSPDDITDFKIAPIIDGPYYELMPHSVVVLAVERT
jgi:isoamylase